MTTISKVYDDIDNIDCYFGSSLKDYINSYGVRKLKERDFVSGISSYLKNSNNKVYSISGLRGVGKTTGILQAIDKLNDYDNSVYIIIDETAKMDCSDLRKVLNEYSDFKYIFIDEITRIKGLISDSAFLADKLVASGKYVVISGTDSLCLVKSSGSGLYHRVVNKNVTHISYIEAKRTIGLTLSQYIDFGGLYSADYIKDIVGVKQYIETAVIDNIINTLNKNNQVTSLLSLSNIKDNSVLRTMVFRILYAVIYSNIRPLKDTNLIKFINQYEFSDSEYYDASTLNSLVCSEMNVDEKITISDSEVKSILDAMVEIGLLIQVSNLVNSSQINYYVTNPSIVTQVTKSILGVLDSTGLDKKSSFNIKSTRGLTYESILMVHTYLVAKKFGCETYFYSDKNSEIDIIIARQYDDEFETKFLLYEVKMTNDQDIAVLKTKWLNNDNVNKDISKYGEIVGKSIIYMGETTVFEDFNSSNCYPPKGSTLDEIKELNSKVQLLNGEEYLLDLKITVKKLCELEEK
jgi:hypothetical protein